MEYGTGTRQNGEINYTGVGSIKRSEVQNNNSGTGGNGGDLLKENVNKKRNSIGLFESCSRPHVYRFNLTKENREL